MTYNGPPALSQVEKMGMWYRYLTPLAYLATGLWYLLKIYQIRTKAIIRKWIGRLAFIISPSFDLICIGIILMWGWTIWFLSLKH